LAFSSSRWFFANFFFIADTAPRHSICAETFSTLALFRVSSVLKGKLPARNCHLDTLPDTTTGAFSQQLVKRRKLGSHDLALLPRLLLIHTGEKKDVAGNGRFEDKPALLRRLFHLTCEYSGQILSYQKMLGQLQDAGNTVTLAHYMELLQGAGMVAGLPKYSFGQVRQRGSSPKLQVLNTALMTAQADISFEEARQHGDFWGRLVESAVGAHLLNSTTGTNTEISYWRERNQEVDFVLRKGKVAAAVEVKSGAP
jgi:Domain of unknown function (DUF4143)